MKPLHIWIKTFLFSLLMMVLSGCPVDVSSGNNQNQNNNNNNVQQNAQNSSQEGNSGDTQNNVGDLVNCQCSCGSGNSGNNGICFQKNQQNEWIPGPCVITIRTTLATCWAGTIGREGDNGFATNKCTRMSMLNGPFSCTSLNPGDVGNATITCKVVPPNDITLPIVTTNPPPNPPDAGDLNNGNSSQDPSNGAQNNTTIELTNNTSDNTSSNTSATNQQGASDPGIVPAPINFN